MTAKELRKYEGFETRTLVLYTTEGFTYLPISRFRLISPSEPGQFTKWIAIIPFGQGYATVEGYVDQIKAIEKRRG